ncbi:hypothetical protein JST97_07720 [bacterium]|nr:hypothetical protein [bacterium]
MMRRFFFLLCLFGWAWAQAPYSRQGLSLNLPPEWTAQELSNEDSTLLAVLHSPRRSLVFVRQHPANPGSRLEDVFNQLKFNVVVKLEGRVLEKEALKIGGIPAMRVKYQGRSSTGAMKNFTRYFFLNEGQLVYVHCVSAVKDSREDSDFRSIAESVTYHRPNDPAPDAEPH